MKIEKAKQHIAPNPPWKLKVLPRPPSWFGEREGGNDRGKRRRRDPLLSYRFSGC